MFTSYIIASTDVDVMLREVLKKVQTSKFEVALFEGKDPKKSFFKSSSEVYRHISSVKEIQIYNSHWVVKVWPSTELFNKYESPLLSKLIVIAGFLLALFLFSSIRTRQIINKQALMLQQTKNTLKEQLLESSRHAKELRLLKEMTDAIQICSSLKDANTPISKYCELLLPGTSGILYLSDNSEKKSRHLPHGGQHLPGGRCFPLTIA